MRTLFLLLSLASIGYGQIELAYTTQKTIVNAVDPVVVGSRIVVANESQPSVVNSATITVESNEPVRIKARRSLFELNELFAITPTSFLLVGDGTYLVEASSLNHERSIKVVIGGGVEPGPNPPKPDPPSPIPPPEPTPEPSPNVPNDYNVGLIAFQNAPKDATNAKLFAKSYREGADKLYGQGGLSVIDQILAEINTKFANRTCKDLETCKQWDVWKTKRDAALIAEQTSRKYFTREDWYAALVEIATALEAVK